MKAVRVLLSIIVPLALGLLLPLSAYHYEAARHQLLPCEVSVPAIEQFNKKLGNSKDLKFVEGRLAYHDALDYGRATLSQLDIVGNDEVAKAQRCHLFRWRARIWARVRNGEHYRLGGVLPVLPGSYLWLALGFRDAVTHTSLTHFLKHPWLALRDFGSCITQHPDHPFCPSFEFLEMKHRGNYTAIGESCYRTNRLHDQLLQSRKESEGKQTRAEDPKAEG